MGADVDSSARTSATRKFLRAGGRGLRHTISNMPTLPHRPGLQPDCRITAGRFARLCSASPPLFLASAKRVHSARLSMYAYWTRHSTRKCAPDCHIFVKGLSVAPDKQRLMREQIKVFKHRGHRGARGTAGLALLQTDTRIPRCWNDEEVLSRCLLRVQSSRDNDRQL